MEKALDIFITWQTLVFCLGVYVMTFVLRTIVEGAWKGALTNRYWTKIAVPLAPIAFGLLLGYLAKKFPWPMPIGDSKSARLMFGSICGMFCAFVYSRVRDWLKKQGIDTSKLPASASQPPPSVATPPADPGAGG